jgi:hypothetical protein
MVAGCKSMIDFSAIPEQQGNVRSLLRSLPLGILFQ